METIKRLLMKLEKQDAMELKDSSYLRLIVLGELLHRQDGQFCSYRFSIILIKSGL
jgi:hypothetical protein